MLYSSKQKIIAITGASGLIGSHLIPVLLREGYQLRSFSRRLQLKSLGVEQIQGDVRSLKAVSELTRGCDAVIHLAGVAHTSLRSQAEMDEAERINVDGAKNVLTAALDAGVQRVILVSSAHVYAGQEGMGLGENSPTSVDSFYARNKLLVEQSGLEAANANRMDVVIARPCLTYGPGVRFNLESLMRAIHGHYYFGVSGTKPMRSFLSVGNAASAIAHLMQAGENSKIYNLADKVPVPLVEFVNSLADLMQVSRPRNLPMVAIRAAIAGTAPLRWMGLRSPINHESLRKLTTSFTLDVNALADTGFRWLDDGVVTKKQMVDAYLDARK
ncbi:MAG: NAD(P)-dependent oxidoreductase [Candidatus Pacebacteria bacterium]|jgi:UDP-glucose 4-epimerase|nr:NAD(P)-dependent oxidoreductase [Candidatus Paceibacterota bacterium]